MRVIGTISGLDLRRWDDESVEGLEEVLTAEQKHCLAVFLKELPNFVELDSEDMKIRERALPHYWAQFL